MDVTLERKLAGFKQIALEKVNSGLIKKVEIYSLCNIP